MCQHKSATSWPCKNTITTHVYQFCGESKLKIYVVEKDYLRLFFCDKVSVFFEKFLRIYDVPLRLLQHFVLF